MREGGRTTIQAHSPKPSELQKASKVVYLTNSGCHGELDLHPRRKNVCQADIFSPSIELGIRAMPGRTTEALWGLSGGLSPTVRGSLPLILEPEGVSPSSCLPFFSLMLDGSMLHAQKRRTSMLATNIILCTHSLLLFSFLPFFSYYQP